MDLKIIGIKNGGEPKQERVLMQATADCDLSSYILFDSSHSDKSKAPHECRPPFVFPRKRVRKGEYVRVYTMSGTPGRQQPPRPDGSPGPIFNSFYWGFDTPLWNNEGDTAMLIRILERQVFEVPADPTPKEEE